MPFKKIGSDEYEHKGKKYTLKQVQAYYASGGTFSKAKKEEKAKKHSMTRMARCKSDVIRMARKPLTQCPECKWKGVISGEEGSTQICPRCEHKFKAEIVTNKGTGEPEYHNQNISKPKKKEDTRGTGEGMLYSRSEAVKMQRIKQLVNQ